MNTKNNPYAPVWIIGCGDIGLRLARLYRATQAETPLHAIVASDASVKKCQALGIETHQINLDKPFIFPEAAFEKAQVYYLVPPAPKGELDSRLGRFLINMPAKPSRFVLISTTGVYGDMQGAWIDETTPVKPQTARAKRRVNAEQCLGGWAFIQKLPYLVLRVPGIYAEDRLPIERIKQGLPIVSNAEAGYTNRIHADDLAHACKAAMECDLSDNNSPVVNVCDGNPSTMTDYFNHVADYAKLPRPPQISLAEAEQTLSEGMVSYLKESRRIRNDKMRELLDFELQHPRLNLSNS